MQRITEKMLIAKRNTLNRITGSPEEAYTKVNGEFKLNIGFYRIDHAYGGVALHRIVNERGGESDVLDTGHIPKRELFNLMDAYIRGLQDGTPPQT
jgi:hypothetical protein